MLSHPSSVYNFQIKSYHSDQDGKLTLFSLFHFLQECAWDNARLNNFGYEFLKENKAFWVLSRILVYMDHYPNWKEEIQIKTWPKGTDGIFALRDFEIILNDMVIGRVTTSWLILDMDTRRPRKLDGFNFFHENFMQEEAIPKKLEKIVLNGDPKILESRKVYYSDLDVNRHVNNASYVRWILDSYFSANHLNSIREFEINFISEISLNDEFTVHSVGNEDDKYFIIKNSKNRDVCKARIK